MFPPKHEHSNERGGMSTLQIERSSSSSTSSLSHSPFSPLQLHRTQNTVTMEEEWKDMNLGSLSDHTDEDLSATLALHQNNHITHNTSNFILQDFFSRPFGRERSQPRIVSPHVMPSTPQTVLCLKTTAPGFDSHDTVTRHASHFQYETGSNVYCLTDSTPYMGVDSASFGTKRVQEFDGNSGDRRHKRMIKNRESAARSRQRKQAYATQLERSVEALKKENNELRMQLAKKISEEEDPLQRKKPRLSRTKSNVY